MELSQRKHPLVLFQNDKLFILSRIIFDYFFHLLSDNIIILFVFNPNSYLYKMVKRLYGVRTKHYKKKYFRKEILSVK